MKKNKQKRKIDIIDIALVIGFLACIVLIGILLYEHFYPYEYNYYYDKFIEGVDDQKITVEKKNDYYRDYAYEYVKEIKYLYPKNRQELINVLYTIINSGEEEVSFYCPKEYKNCTKDAEDLVYDKKKNVISLIYEFSHPFNDYKSISCATDKETGLVIYHLNKKYSKKKIKAIEKEVDRLYKELVNENDDARTNILRIHDYLVNNIEYDKEKSNYIDKKSDKDSEFDSTTAYGALIQHKAICSGYTDSMYLFLDKMGIRSMRITSSTHIWNAVYLDGSWVNLDLTWDDGRYTSGRSFLSHKYFLVDTKTMLEEDKESHTFNQEVYKELSIK